MMILEPDGSLATALQRSADEPLIDTFGNEIAAAVMERVAQRLAAIELTIATRIDELIVPSPLPTRSF